MRPTLRRLEGIFSVRVNAREFSIFQRGMEQVDVSAMNALTRFPDMNEAGMRPTLNLRWGEVGFAAALLGYQSEFLLWGESGLA